MAFITNPTVLLPFFDEAFYLNDNPDVQSAVADGIFDDGFEHFFEFGLSEGRIPREELTFFSSSGYEDSNPDVDAAVENGVFASGLEHFLTFGLNNEEVSGRIEQGGTGFEFFNETFYLSNNPDVQDAFINGFFDSGLEHFIQFGLNEGRVSGEVLTFFNEDTYLENNNDVAIAVQNDVFGSALEHFLLFGVDEGRDGTGYDDFFNEENYLEQNGDVAAAVTNGVFGTGLEHYINFGFAEGRVIPPGTVTVDPVTQAESSITFEFDVITNSALNATLDFSVVGTGTDATLPSDFEGGVNPAGTVDIINGVGTISFEIADDAIDEPDETFQLALTNPLDDDELVATAIGTIVDDDIVT